LIFSGGTTGLPKGVEHDHQGLAVTMAQHCTAWPVEFGVERFLSVAPLFHIWGLGYAALAPIYARGTLVLVPKFEPEALLQAIDTHRITVFAGGPAPIYSSLMGSPGMQSVDFSSLKYCLTGGAPCPEELHRAWQAATGCRLLEGYGMSETGPMCLTPANRPSKLLSVGFPVAETEIQIVDIDTGSWLMPANEPGEIRARGPQFTRGYRRRPDETAQLIRDGWLYTGDIGYLDEAGHLFLIDRKKEMVIVGGYNVYPRQVDEVLMNHPKILEAATIGKPDARLGEVMVAFVVLKAGQQMTEEDFFEYCRDSMVKYKRPVEVTFMETLPRTGARKIDKRALRQGLAG
jgi:long-chain acyl-CoA synthetase